MRLGSRLTIRVQLRVIPHMPVCNVILGSRFLRHYDPIIRWSKGYMRIHGVRIPFLDCELPSQELQRAGVLVVDPTPTPINDIFGDEDPCLHESSSSPGTFSVSPILEDKEVIQLSSRRSLPTKSSGKFCPICRTTHVSNCIVPANSTRFPNF